jgi:class 3 adenylate cyclase
MKALEASWGAESSLAPAPLKIASDRGICSRDRVCIGSEFWMSYTVMGDTINLASRLKGANKRVGLWSPATTQSILAGIICLVLSGRKALAADHINIFR